MQLREMSIGRQLALGLGCLLLLTLALDPGAWQQADSL